MYYTKTQEKKNISSLSCGENANAYAWYRYFTHFTDWETLVYCDYLLKITIN